MINIQREGESYLPLVPQLPEWFAAYGVDSGDSARLTTEVTLSYQDQVMQEITVNSKCGDTVQYPGRLSWHRKPLHLQESPSCDYKITANDSHTTIALSLSGSNPFFTYFDTKLAPPIITNYNINIKPVIGHAYSPACYEIDISGEVTDFPAHSIQVTVNGKPVSEERVYAPENGRTPMHLFFGPRNRIHYHTAITPDSPPTAMTAGSAAPPQI